MFCLCGGVPCRQVVIVHLVWRLAVKRPVWSLLIVEYQVALQALVCGADGLVGVQIDLLVFNAFPRSFHEHVVPPTPFPVHADLDAVVLQEPRELLAGELAPLIGMEDLRRAIVGQGVLDCFQAEVGRERVGQPPRQHSTTGPVEHREQIDEAPCHRNVGDIRRPDVIGATDRQIPKEIGRDGVGRLPVARARLAIQSLKAHASHQGRHMSPSNGLALLPQEIAQHADAGKRMKPVEFIQPTHQRELHP